MLSFSPSVLFVGASLKVCLNLRKSGIRELFSAAAAAVAPAAAAAPAAALSPAFCSNTGPKSREKGDEGPSKPIFLRLLRFKYLPPS